MPPSSPVRLEFDPTVSQVTRSRMEYAFRVFSAIYNYRISDQGNDREVRTFFYGPPEKSSELRDVMFIPGRYIPRPMDAPPPEPSKVHYAGEDFYLFHGIDVITQTPDWLGEIFEWLSSSHELGIRARDRVGRIPDHEMIFEAAGISPWKPQAALQMAWLQQATQGSLNSPILPIAPSPAPDAEHFVICSHDLDYYFTNRASGWLRLVKNLGIAVTIYRSWAYFYANSRMILESIRGNRPGDYLPPLFDRMEQNGSSATLFVVPVHTHRRDPNYALADLAPQLTEAARRGFSVEIHGSYESIIENRCLLPEVQGLQQITGKKASGSRQHWLRFDSSEHLFDAIEDSGLRFDSSMGFTSTVGFRSGACFAFPPYDFKNERPYNFLEIPLAIMDGSLIDSSRASGDSPQFLADRVLNESRKRGWGGISILWHNPLEALSVPDRVNEVFWKCANTRQDFREKWVSTDQFLSVCLPRYHNAGLLKKLAANS